MPGVPGAILGVGLDTFGLWPQMFEGRSGGYPGGFPPAFPGSFGARIEYNVTLRGPGDGTANTNTGILVGGQPVPNYGFLESTGALADQSLLSLDAGLAAPSPIRPNDGTGPAFREAEIFVDTTQIPTGHLPVTVSIIEGTTGAQTVLGTFDIYQQLLQFYGSAANFPRAVHFGFSGGTGDFTQFHDIRLVEVETTDEVGPDLSILKEHYPSEFERGSTGTYYILVANESTDPTFGQVTVTDTIPTGLVPTSASGVGWACGISSQTVTCTRSDALAGGGNFDQIIVSVNVLPSAPATVTNAAIVACACANTATSTDTTVIVSPPPPPPTPEPILSILKSNSPTQFERGSTGTYYISVSNQGTAPTFGQITVSDTFPTGITPTSASGVGWTTCGISSQTVTCTRTNALAAGGTFNDIVVSVNVLQSAPSSVTNSATAACACANAVTASDTVAIVNPPPTQLSILKIHYPSEFERGSTGTYHIVVDNAGTTPTFGQVTVTDTIPTGLTPTSASGVGWTCGISSQTVTCTRSDVLAGGDSYNDIIVSVNVLQSAPSSVTNAATAACACASTVTSTDVTVIVNPAPPPSPTTIPILSTWGFSILGGGLLFILWQSLRRRTGF